MNELDIDLLLIRILKEKSSITLADIVSVIKEATAIFNEQVTDLLKQINIFDNIMMLDDDISVGELKKAISHTTNHLYSNYIRATTVVMAHSIKEKLIDTSSMTQEELTYANELLDSLVEMQRLYNFIKHFSKTLQTPDLVQIIHNSMMQRKIEKAIEEKTAKKLAILEEIEKTQIRIIELKRQRDRWINKITGKSKQISFTIRMLEEKIEILRRQLRSSVTS